MTDAQLANQPTPAVAAAHATIAKCDAKLEHYWAALDVGADPSIVSMWIA
ncbi:hypothetical protein ABZ814_29055 [Micromonospora musae]